MRKSSRKSPTDCKSLKFSASLSYRASRSVSRGQRRDTGLLLKALVEAEIDGVAVSNHLTALKDTIDSLSKVNWIPKCPLERAIQDGRFKKYSHNHLFLGGCFFCFLGQEAHESARSFNEAAAGVVVRKDQHV